MNLTLLSAALPAVLPGALPGTENPTADFSQDNGWVIFGKALFVFVFLVLTTLIMIWAERRVVARMQSRPGPNRTGPFGLLQSLADGVKLALKEDVTPKSVDALVFVLAPIISAMTCFIAFAVIPFGPAARIPFTDIVTPLQLTDLPVAVLFMLAVAAVGVYGIVLAGWSSGSTYPLLGGLRSSAQVISYEIAMGLALISVFLYAGSMSTSSIVDGQRGLWYAIQLPVAFVIYMIAMVGETNRAPFDLPEAEGELVGGFHTEYSSLKFALFFLAEYVNMVTVSAIATTLFLGGWRAPWPLSAIGDGVLNTGWWPMLWFVVKLWALLVRLHLATRHLAPAAVRPVHAVRLEGVDPDRPGLDRRRLLHPHPAVERRLPERWDPDRPGGGAARADRRGDGRLLEQERGRRQSREGSANTPCGGGGPVRGWLPGAADARPAGASVVGPERGSRGRRCRGLSPTGAGDQRR